MEIDRKILEKITAASYSSYSILKVSPPHSSFYLKRKPLLNRRVLSQSTLTKTKQIPNPHLFITQVLPKVNSKLPSFMKIFNICLKSEKDRKREEISSVSSWLQDVSFLYPLSPSRLASLAKSVKSRYIRKGDYLFKENEVLDCFFFILNGEVLLFRNGHKCGNRHQREIVGENSFVGEESQSFSAVAGSELHLFFIQTVELLKIVAQEPVHVNILLTRVLKSFPLFTSIPFLKVFAFCKKLTPVNVRQCSMIFKPGDTCKSFFVLVYGKAREKHGTFDGFEDWRIIPPESYFGTREYILKGTRRTTVEVTSNSLVYEVKDLYCRGFLRKMFIESSKQEDIFEVPYQYGQESEDLEYDLTEMPSILNSSYRKVNF
jgi:CRP-like cAMP-binding protein